MILFDTNIAFKKRSVEEEEHRPQRFALYAAYAPNDLRLVVGI